MQKNCELPRHCSRLCGELPRYSSVELGKKNKIDASEKNKIPIRRHWRRECVRLRQLVIYSITL